LGAVVRQRGGKTGKPGTRILFPPFRQIEYEKKDERGTKKEKRKGHTRKNSQTRSHTSGGKRESRGKGGGDAKREELLVKSTA